MSSERQENARRPSSSCSAQLRKVNKPLVERRRRERINRCIDELKSLLVTRRQMIGSSRLDKTEILELAVDELRDLSHADIRRSSEGGTQDEVAYTAGYEACASEALRQIAAMDNLTMSSRQRLMTGLTAHLQRSSAVDDVSTATVTSPPVAVPPCRRLFEPEREPTTFFGSERRHRRPLAEIQSSAVRDGSLLSRSRPTGSAFTAVEGRVPFLLSADVASCCSSSMSAELPRSPSMEVLSRRVTVTQTTTTMDRRVTAAQCDFFDQSSENHFEADSSFSPSGTKLEPMWRPW